jgi:hypothetical protein
VIENRVLGRIFGPKRDEVTGEWRKLHNEEPHNLYSYPDIITQIKSRRMRCAGHVARMGEKRKVYKVLVRKPEGKRPLGRPRFRWDNWIRMDIRFYPGIFLRKLKETTTDLSGYGRHWPRDLNHSPPR